jgi:hypothetical protein
VCICLCVSKCRCAHAAIGRPFSTCEKGKKHPRLRLTSLDSTKIDQKGRHHPRRPGLQSYRGAEGWRTHTHIHTPRALWEKGEVEFFHWQFQCPLLNFLASVGFKLWLRIHDGDECAANIPRSSTLTTTLWTDMEKWVGLSTNSCYCSISIYFLFRLFLLFRLFILHVTLLLY